MEHRRIGNTGLKVSAVSIGGWLTFGARVDLSASRRILSAAIDRGVNFVDLADVSRRGRGRQSARSARSSRATGAARSS
ncbi:MAG: hypothetical protein M5U28_12550 [Sandaracinaceae bacterium]|nr:hypothetical protein [Sandaracinaceae bacterium]